MSVNTLKQSVAREIATSRGNAVLVSGGAGYLDPQPVPVLGVKLPPVRLTNGDGDVVDLAALATGVHVIKCRIGVW